jgi:hypothetical protein
MSEKQLLVPIALGAMFGVSGGHLAGAVAKAGGFGFVGVGGGRVGWTVDKMKKEWADAWEISGGCGMLGVGFLPHYWQSKEDRSKDTEDPLFHFVLNELHPTPDAVWLSFYWPGSELALSNSIRFTNQNQNKNIKIIVQVKLSLFNLLICVI